MKMTYRAIVLIFVVIETFTIIQGYILFREWVPMGLMCAVSMLMYPKAFLNKSALCLFLYGGILMMFAGMGHAIANPRWVLIEIMVTLSCFSIIAVFTYNLDFFGLKTVTVVGLLIILIIALLTIPLAINDPMAVRRMVTYSVTGNTFQIQSYQRQGMASFGLVHAFPFLCSLLVLHVKSGKNYLFRIFAAVVLLVTYYMLVKASFATPLILSSFAIAYALVLSKNNKRNIVVGIVMVCFLSFFLNKEIIVSNLETVNKLFFVNTPIAEKIDHVVSSLKHNKSEEQVAGREKAYKRSWDTFFENPLIGNLKKDQAGGHAYFADRLAYFGLLGSVPFFMFFYFTIKNSFSLLSNNVRPHYLLAVATFIPLALLKNITGVENFLYLLVFLPGLGLLAEPAAETGGQRIAHSGSDNRGIA